MTSNVISRTETKYELDAESADRLRAIVARHVPFFEYRKGHRFTRVTTVYFDTDRLDLYRRATRSYEDSLKIRLREYSYETSDGEPILLPYCFLEIKRRTRALVIKHRLRIAKTVLGKLLAGADVWDHMVEENTEIDNGTLRKIYDKLRRFLSVYRLSPRSVIRYRRAVHQVDESELRITFDDQLTIYPPARDLYEASPTLVKEDGAEDPRKLDMIIMEIKCQNGQPGWLEDALENFLPRNISKFTESISQLVG